MANVFRIPGEPGPEQAPEREKWKMNPKTKFRLVGLTMFLVSVLGLGGAVWGGLGFANMLTYFELVLGIVSVAGIISGIIVAVHKD